MEGFEQLLSPKISFLSSDTIYQSSKSMRGVSTDTLFSKTSFIGSLDYVFPLIQFKNSIDYYYGHWIGITLTPFWEIGTFNQNILSFKKESTIQTAGIEIGFTNTSVLEIPFTLSLGYAKKIASPLKADSQIYFNMNTATNLFTALYTY